VKFTIDRCKTPVSSLSSRITEDVRSKGNKSVFIRVGEGLYTLRKGMKKSDLEKFMSTQMPSISSKTSWEEEIEEEEQEEDEEEEDNNLSAHWIGLPLKTAQNGITYYGHFKMGKYRYRIGDFVYLEAKMPGDRGSIGQILKMFNDIINNETLMLIKVRCFVYAEDIQEISVEKKKVTDQYSEVSSSKRFY
jgi:hypothetical protein